MKALVAFDLDDTLVPEVCFLRSGISHIAGWLSARFPQLNPLRVVDCMEAAVACRRNHYDALEALLDASGLRALVDMKAVVTEFRNHRPDPDCYHMAPSVSRLLGKLCRRGVPLAIVTDGRSVTQRNKIRAAGLCNFVHPDNILISEETGHDKTDPDNFLLLMRKYAEVNRFFFVADNPAKDFIHPLRLGWKTLLVPPFPLAIHQGIPR